MNHIKSFWDNQAKQFKEAPEASWGDNFAVSLEVESIGEYINEHDTVLDVGCSNGHATIQQMKRNPSLLVGVDYSAEMIKNAKKHETEKIRFEVGDILDLPFKDKSFDVVFTTRCLINLPTWEEQQRGINECLRVAKRKLILSEAFYEPLVSLNSLRAIVGLPPLLEHDFNRYLKKSKLDLFLKEKGIEFSCNDFSSIYYIGSRLIRELTTDISKYEGYSNPINEMFYNIETSYSFNGVGIQQLYAIKP